ncbi:MAG: FecCD family ABC transporter permease [Rhodoferax sp.]
MTPSDADASRHPALSLSLTLRRRPGSINWRWSALALLPALAMLGSLCLGRLALAPDQVVRSLLGLGEGAGLNIDTLVWAVRMPRTLLAALCGGGLALSGAALQGVLRNPLAGPQNLGVLAGAGFGGSLGLLLAWGPAAAMALAFAGGLLAMGMVLWMARGSGDARGRGTILLLILAGVVVSALFAAGTTLLQYLADPERQLPSLVYWLMGSFSVTTPGHLVWALGPIVLGGGLLLTRGARMNLLASGDDEAHALGLRVERERLVVLASVALVCAAVVAVAGIVGWVGLVMPHLARLLVGPDHRRLLPASMLLGAAFLVAVDTLCRTVMASEIPLGAVTALIGAPVFIHLLRRSHGSGWRVD